MFASAAHPGFVQQLRQERILLWCVLASVALHALVLVGVSPQIVLVPQAKTLLVLTARLAPVAAVPEAKPQAPQPAPPAAPKPAPVPPPPKAAPPLPKPAPAPKPVPAPRPVAKPAVKAEPAPQQPVPTEAAKPVPGEPTASTTVAAAPGAQTAAPGPVALARPGTPGAAAGAPESSVSEADKGTLERYRLALIVATRRYKRYPAIAMEKGWQGRVEVRMVIGANGMLSSTSIKTSSGHEVLDVQAIDMLRKGKTTVQVPPSLRGREFSVDVPVVFNLDDPNS